MLLSKLVTIRILHHRMLFRQKTLVHIALLTFLHIILMDKDILTVKFAMDEFDLHIYNRCSSDGKIFYIFFIFLYFYLDGMLLVVTT